MRHRWPIVGVSLVVLVGLSQSIAMPTASADTGTGTTTTTVTAYSGPGDSNAALSTFTPQTTVSFTCYVRGESVSGEYDTENFWDALVGGGYVPDALLYTGYNYPVVPQCPSDQFGVGTYPVAWTGGAGAQPYSGTSTSTSPEGAVLPDGLLVSVTCETSGETLTDSANFTSDLWDQLDSGAYIPNVFIDTEVNAPTPGLPACAQPGPGSTTGSTSTPTPAPPPPVQSTPAEQPTPTQVAPAPASTPPTSAAAASSTPEQCEQPTGTYIVDQGDDSVPYALYDHYMWAHGTPAVIDWSFFSQSTSFVQFAKSLSVGQSALYRDGVNTALFWALGTFTVTRTSNTCYAIEDHFDFKPTAEPKKLIFTIFTLPEWAYQLSGAREFYIRAAGHL